MSNEIVDAVVDDLTESECAVCGTRFELTRPNCLVVDGRVFGEVVCTDCVCVRNALRVARPT